MSFLATAPDDGHPGTRPGPGPSASEAGLASTSPLADASGPDKGLDMPLVDPAALQELGAGLDDPGAARDFARDYIKMWGGRYGSLAAALGRGDGAGALDAVLSLKISSAMAGGICLSRLAGEVEDAIRGGDLDGARSFLPRVADCGRETMKELQGGQDLQGP